MEDQTLSEANQKLVDQLTHAKIRLDESMEHTTATRVHRLNPSKSFNVKKVAAYCKENNIVVLRVYSAYGKGSYNYPNTAWRAIYPKVVLPDTFFTKEL